MQISWQYLAGFLDGEGSIGTTRTGKLRNVVGRVTIANTDHAILELIKSQFGGTITRRERGNKPGWRPFCSISWTNRSALSLLEGVLPYLILKRAQAELCIQLIRMKDQPKSERCVFVHTPTRGFPSRILARISPEVQAAEQAIAMQIKEMNRKGVPI